MPELWPHQVRTLSAIEQAIQSGHKRICVTAPTGAGKSLTMRERIRTTGKPSIIYTNRRMLREQMSGGLDGDGLEHGVRAAGSAPELWRDVQVSSIQTEASRVYKAGHWELHKAAEVHVDEAHAQKADTAKKVMQDHLAQGAAILGWTATPVDIGDCYDHLIVSATNSELRECGAHVRCVTYGPDEPDLRHIGPVKVGEDLSESQNRKAIMRPGIFGRVQKWYDKLNPDRRPAILFAPGVKESLWFAEQFQAAGINAAHIDGEEVFIMGQRFPSSREVRQQLAEASQSGEIQVVCNRFVMREGIDWPWLYHCIFACVFGSLGTYLQAGGRLLRSHPSLTETCLQDHGGNYHRHGSLNADRVWDLRYTSHMVSSLREERLRDKQEDEPIVCPECGKVRAGGAVCQCGYRCSQRSRRVVMADGSLKQMEGPVYKPLRVKEQANTQQVWERIYQRAKRSGMTFRQARGLFMHENYYYPPKTLPFMPKNDLDWFRKVKDVPARDLT